MDARLGCFTDKADYLVGNAANLECMPIGASKAACKHKSFNSSLILLIVREASFVHLEACILEEGAVSHEYGLEMGVLGIWEDSLECSVRPQIRGRSVLC